RVGLGGGPVLIARRGADVVERRVRVGVGVDGHLGDDHVVTELVEAVTAQLGRVDGRLEGHVATGVGPEVGEEPDHVGPGDLGDGARGIGEGGRDDGARRVVQERHGGAVVLVHGVQGVLAGGPIDDHAGVVVPVAVRVHRDDAEVTVVL